MATPLPDATGDWLVDEGAGTPDAVLETLRRVLDVDSMRSCLQPHFEPEARIHQVEVHHLAFDPRRAARVAYRLQLADRQGNGCIHFMAALVRAEGAASMRQRTAARVRPRFGPAFQWLEDPGMAVFGFPNDPKLHGIATLTPESLASQLSMAPGAVSTGEIVRYVPCKRLLMRSQGIGQKFFTKTVSRDRGRTGLQVAEALWRRSGADPVAFVVARPLVYLHEAQTLVQEELEGWQPLCLPAYEGWAPWGARVGRALARLHTGAQPSLEAWSSRDDLAQLAGALRRLVRHEPAWLSQCQAIWKLAIHAEPPSSSHEVPIHSAFRVSQMLIRDDRLALVDLEGFRRGDPHVDVANLIAHLCERVFDGELEWRDVEAALGAVLQAYAEEVPWKIDPVCLAWHAAVRSVAGYAKNCLSRLEARLATKIPAMLEEALTGLQQLPRLKALNDSQT